MLIEWPFQIPFTVFRIAASYPQNTYEQRMKIISKMTIANYKTL